VDYASRLYDESYVVGVAQPADVGHNVAFNQDEISSFTSFHGT
jgi:hypothetical protein